MLILLCFSNSELFKATEAKRYPFILVHARLKQHVTSDRLNPEVKKIKEVYQSFLEDATAYPWYQFFQKECEKLS